MNEIFWWNLLDVIFWLSFLAVILGGVVGFTRDVLSNKP